jgi:hypothetical protein
MQATTAPVGPKKQSPAEYKTDVADSPPVPTKSVTYVTKEQAKWWVPPPPWDIYWPTIGLVLASGFAVRAALKTLRAINSQVEEMRETGKQTDKLIAENIAQSTSMQQSVAEATRLASAMEAVSKEIAVSAKAATESVAALKERTAKQMRAYLTVVFGSGVPQERQKQLRFEAKPALINAGHTPAHNVRYQARAEILPVPLPEDFAFPLTGEFVGGALIGPQQNVIISAVVDDYCDDGEIEDIKTGKGKVLYIWGIVMYTDVFGEDHYTKFCQSTLFTTDGKVFGFFLPKHNEAT